MHVVIHAGLPKTGSTAIQDTLALNRNRLAEAGFVYPYLGDERFQEHWLLSAFWAEFIEGGYLARRTKRLPPGWAARTRADVEANLRAAQTRDATVLLSSEALGSEDALPGLITLRALIERFTTAIRVIAYARPPLDLFPSMVQQRLKGLSTPIDVLPSDWLSNHPDRIDRLITAFGPENVHVRVYSRQRDAVADFIDWIEQVTGRPIPALSPAPDANTSLPGAACAILARLRQRMKVGEDDRCYGQMRRLLSEFEPSRPMPKLQLPDEWRALISARNAAAWNRIVDMTDHPEAEKARFRLATAGCPPHSAIANGDFWSWVLSYHDHDYLDEFRRYCRTRTERWAGAAANQVDTLA